MVTRIIGLVLGVTLAANGYALTADQLRDMTQRAQSNAKSRDSRLAPGDVTPVLPAQRRDDTAASPAASSTSTDKAASKRVRAKVAAGDSSTTAMPTRDTGSVGATVYQPPMRTASTTKAADTFVYAAPWTYGVSVGTWLDGELERAVTNVELGDVAIRVTQPVAGRYRTLEVGSMLYGDKVYNSGSRRLEITVRHGVDSNGHAFALGALVYDASHARAAGLGGEVHKNEETGSRASKVTALAVAREGLRQLTAGNAIATAVGAGADTVINDESQKVAVDAAQYIIQVPMQPVQLRIVTAF
ncbi:MAG: hypothetical protein AABY83_15305 [Pseudomonadota bacterium]